MTGFGGFREFRFLGRPVIGGFYALVDFKAMPPRTSNRPDKRSGKSCEARKQDN